MAFGEATAQRAGYREVRMEADGAVSACDRVSERGYCPRCRREVPLITLEQAARLGEDIPGEHIVLLPAGELRLCLGLEEPSART